VPPKEHCVRFSVGNFPRSWSAEHDEEVINTTVEQALLADELGYAAVFFPEHHFTGYAPTGADIFQVGAYLAPQMKQAWLGFSVVVVPHHHPAHLAEQMNLLDQFAKGKVLFGVGSGIRAEEALGLGVDDTRYQMSQMTNELLRAAELLWDKKPEDPLLQVDTRYYKAALFERIVPAPYRKRRPNLMAGVRGAVRRLERVAGLAAALSHRTGGGGA
jgi:alkanesulfonate monooxygenase SsuD/methylene tetrahydromethanopterin reductase-like flavin-dependent oxidoreductase (luciferase family)